MFAEADPVYAEELERQLSSTGARQGMGATQCSAGRRVGARARICAGCVHCRCLSSRDRTWRPRWRSVVDDLADFEIVVDQAAPAQLEPFESYTVAVLNRGMPGFAVDSDGTLHISLMRSCTGWPSGTWIDPPRRTAPDGSNFQLQHWTHTFDYAVVSGDGDWRQAGIPARSAEFSRPLQAVTESSSAAGGLPASGSLLEIEPAGTVQLGALKAAGNPLAGGSGQHVHPSDGVAMRLVETSGATADVVVRSGLRRVSASARVDLLEQPRVQNLWSERAARCTASRSPRC